MSSSWTIPVQRRRRGSTAAARPKPAASPKKAPPKPLRQGKDWDFTTQDHGKYKLSTMEQEWRKAQRISKHSAAHSSRLHDSQLHRSQPAELDGFYQDEVDEAYCPSLASLVPKGDGNTAYEDDGASTCGSSSTDSTEVLQGMRSFINEMQHKYTLSPARGRVSAAQQKLAQLRREAAAARRADSSASEGRTARSDASGLDEHVAVDFGRRPLGPPAAEAWLAEVEAREAQRAYQAEACLPRRQLCASLGKTPAGHQQELASAADVAVLADRLAAAEARLGKQDQLQREVEHMREQHSVLQSELNEFVTHTSTLMTSLQTAISNLAVAADRRLPSPPPAQEAVAHADPVSPAATASGVASLLAPFRSFQLSQEQAAAQQLAAAQLASQAACGHTQHMALGAQPPPPATAAAPAEQQHGGVPSSVAQDVLMEVQLPSYSQRFSSLAQERPSSLQRRSSLPGRAAMQAAPAAGAQGHSSAEKAQGRHAHATEAWRESLRGEGSENTPPKPRPLPPAMQSRLMPARMASSPTAGVDCDTEFQWRPCSAAT